MSKTTKFYKIYNIKDDYYYTSVNSPFGLFKRKPNMKSKQCKSYWIRNNPQNWEIHELSLEVIKREPLK